MNENKNNEEIEVLDGLEDFFDTTPNKTESVEKTEEEEVFSVLDEPEDAEKFSTFEPDQIEEEPTFEDIEMADLKPTIEPVIEPEVFSMEGSTEPSDALSLNVEEEPIDFPSFSSDTLEAIEIAATEPEMVPTDEMFQWNTEPMEGSESDDIAKEEATVDMNYNFMEEFAPQESPVLEDAFQFEPTKTVEESLELPEETYDSDALGKTVVIEPVEPKEMQEEKPVETPVEEVVEVSKENVEEKPKKSKKIKKEKKNKGNGRTMLFVVLLGILLLAFVALIPMLLETFAV